ncbi:hypothetical protein FHS83_000988 [Rhizomicrobium palustre]|uniref:DUF2336 domain-containing protein n=1 Tax=Rhizomicrobium palustre TaxID=189966 RepID=A0A846MXC2_9PROT|nr:DUF2336 domain-containing protein [Rhizomicrobium palustre]NIK87670.1 hypothetical protein [Rhizomicrobium palustre]
MVTARARLNQLLAMAAERKWAPLARDLAELVLSWPADCPVQMRGPMLALFETALREADAAILGEIAPRFAGRSDVPLKVLNLLYLSAPAPLRREILLRNGLENEEMAAVHPADSLLILSAARNGARDFASAFAVGTGLTRRMAEAVLADRSGEALAVVCRSTGLDRATFSALVLLKAPRGTQLSAYDTVTPKAAAHLMQEWQKFAPLKPHAHAAE